MKVLLQDERLHGGADEEQSSVEVALPGGGAGIIDKLDKQSTEKQETKEH